MAAGPPARGPSGRGRNSCHETPRWQGQRGAGEADFRVTLSPGPSKMQTAWWVGVHEVSSVSSPLGTWPALRRSRASDSPSVPLLPSSVGPRVGVGRGVLGKRGRKSQPRQRQREGGDLPSQGLWEGARQAPLWVLRTRALLGLQQFRWGENHLNWASCADEAARAQPENSTPRAC